MKLLSYFTVILFVLSSCQSVRVAADYDTSIDFSTYKTFAFHKASIDKVEISDLDKRRILNAIDAALSGKGLSKSQVPDLLISISTKAQEKVYVNQMSYGFGMGWNPWFYGGNTFNTVNSVIEGTLFIDIVDSKTQNLIWQGKGHGALSEDPHEKDLKIKEFVNRILTQYPPQKRK